MNINKNNYEKYFIDYFDGNLRKDDKEELLHFLKNNPDLLEEFEEFENIKLKPNKNISFRKKEILKKIEIVPAGKINENNFNDYFIAFYENELTTKEKDILNQFLSKNPGLKKDFDIYSKTFLKPDKDIIYENKHKLKQYPFKLRKKILYAISIAASVLLILGLSYIFSDISFFNSGKHEIANVISMQNIKTNHIIVNSESDKLTSITVRQENQEIIKTIQMTPEEKSKVFKLTPLESPDLFDYLGLQDNEQLFLTPRFENYRQTILQTINNDDNLYTDNIYEEAEDKSLMGRIIKNTFNKVKSVFQRNIPEQENLPFDNISFWKIAQTGVKGYNFFTDKEVVLERTVDDQGRTKSFSILSDNIQFSQRTKK